MSVVVDVETYSELNVKNVGAEAYARHPSTDITVMCYSIDDGPAQAWAPWLPFPDDLAAAVQDETCLFEAHNAAFERCIWAFVGEAKHGFPHLHVKRWRCTLAMACRKGLAPGLDDAAAMAGVGEQKDPEGVKAMRWLASPTWRKHKECRGEGCAECGYRGKTAHRRFDFERHELATEYCKQDVRTESALSRMTSPLEPRELTVWKLDQAINQRGVLIDQELCHAAIEVARQITEPLVAEFSTITGGLAPSQRDAVMGWMKEHSPEWPMDNLQAETVAEALHFGPVGGMKPYVHRALQIRAEIAKTSVAKYTTALACLCPDGRARGMLQYYGAIATGRFAGRLIQLQNLPRPKFENFPMEDLVAIIKMRDAELLRMMFGDPMQALSDATRGIIIPSPGHVLAAYDYSSIEAIALAGMFREEWKLEAFRRGDCAYCLAAEHIFGYKVTKKEHPQERQVGKICELAFGYEGGVGAWRNFDSSDRHTDEDVQRYKRAWRAKHLNVTAGWKGLNVAALRTVVDGVPHEYAGFRYELEGRWLTCRLISGRKLYYLDPRAVMATMPWETDDGEPEMRPAVEFTSYKRDRGIVPIRGYGGHWTENNDQAVCRDILVQGLLRCERAGFRTILSVHDEGVFEVPEDDADRARKEIPQLLSEPMPWCADWPIKAEGGLLTRYQK